MAGIANTDSWSNYILYMCNATGNPQSGVILCRKLGKVVVMETQEFENVTVAAGWLLSDDKIRYQTYTKHRSIWCTRGKDISSQPWVNWQLSGTVPTQKKLLLVNALKLFPRIEHNYQPFIIAFIFTVATSACQCVLTVMKTNMQGILNQIIKAWWNTKRYKLATT